MRTRPGWTIFLMTTMLAALLPGFSLGQGLEAVVPILGISTGPDQRGRITYATIVVDRLATSSSFQIEFADGPGRFSEEAKQAIATAIDRAARHLGVTLARARATFRAVDPNIVIYGHSLSAIMALTTVALMEGHVPVSNCAVTGTIEADGRIGAVGRVTEKITAAAEARYSRILVPDHPATYETEWRTPFLMQVSPVRTAREAYAAFLASPDAWPPPVPHMTNHSHSSILSHSSPR